MSSRLELETEAQICVGILTVSDSCFFANATDRSGTNLRTLINDRKILPAASVTANAIVPDDVEEIKEKLVTWSDEMGLDLILTTGGTGFAPRDVTPEATRAVIDREAIGLTLGMLKGSIELTPMAMLSRPVCGTRGSTLIINLPGSKKGAAECLDFVMMAIPHAVDLLQGNKDSIKSTHERIQAAGVANGLVVADGVRKGKVCGKAKSEAQNVAKRLKSKVDGSKTAERPRHSPYEIVSVEEAVTMVLREAEGMQQIEEIEAKSALNRVVASRVTARDALPPFPASIKDGYAVLASDCPGVLKVLGYSSAGDAPSAVTVVTSGVCCRVNTGAPLAAGADAVVQVEDTRLVTADEGAREVEIEVLRPCKVGQDIRKKGSDISDGQVVLEKGVRLGPSELGLLATVGVAKVQTFRLPLVGVLSTGNELVEPETEVLPSGAIRDANRTTLLNLLTDSGFPVMDLGVAKDDPDSLYTMLHEATSRCDVIVSTGGVSMGERDFMKEVLKEDMSAYIHFGRVFMKPGKPTTFATALCRNGPRQDRKTLFFGLPGNPVSAVVTANLYVLPVCRLIAGRSDVQATIVRAKLNEDLKLDPRPEYHRCVLKWSPGADMPTATSTGNQISSRLLSMANANGLILLPSADEADAKVKAKGSIVNTMIIGQL